MEKLVVTAGVPKKFVKIRPVIINGERKISIRANIAYFTQNALNESRKRRLVDACVGTDPSPKIAKLDGEKSTGTNSNITPTSKTFPSKGQMLMGDVEKFTRLMEDASKEESFENRTKEETDSKQSATEENKISLTNMKASSPSVKEDTDSILLKEESYKPVAQEKQVSNVSNDSENQEKIVSSTGQENTIIVTGEVKTIASTGSGKETASPATVVHEKTLPVSCEEDVSSSMSLGQKTLSDPIVKNTHPHLINEQNKISQSVVVEGNEILKPGTNQVFQNTDDTLVLDESLVQSDSKQDKIVVDTQNVSASNKMEEQKLGALTSIRDNLITEIRALMRIRKSQKEKIKEIQQLKERLISNTERAKLQMNIKTVNNEESKRPNEESKCPNEESKCPNEESKRPGRLELQIKALTLMKPQFLEELVAGYKEVCRIASIQINKIAMGAEFLSLRNKRNLEDVMARRYEEFMNKKLLVALPEEEFQNYPLMSREMLGVIDRAFLTHGPNDILVEFQSLRITREALSCLIGLNWLNDDVINMYMELIMERSRNEPDLPFTYAFNTFFLPKILSGGQASVRRWTRKVDIFGFDLIVVPCHLGIHWCMAIIDFRDKTVRYYDSVGNPNNEALQAIFQYLNDEHLDKKKEPFDGDDWRLINVKGNPQQQNGSDCGVFSCITAEHICRDSNLTFSQKNIPYFRKKMIYEILTRQLIT